LKPPTKPCLGCGKTIERKKGEFVSVYNKKKTHSKACWELYRAKLVKTGNWKRPRDPYPRKGI